MKTTIVTMACAAAMCSPLAIQAQTVAVPADFADTSPLLTVATEVLLLDQFTFLFVAFVG